MLHGDIKVNNQVIGEWQAIRMSADLRDFNDYECRMTYRNMAGYPMEACWMLRQHAANNGAVALTARILMEGMTHLRTKPVREDQSAIVEVVRRLSM